MHFKNDPSLKNHNKVGELSTIKIQQIITQITYFNHLYIHYNLILQMKVSKIDFFTFSHQVTPLVKPISTVKARGQVDKWLVELEIQMRLSLKQQVRKFNLFGCFVHLRVGNDYFETKFAFSLRNV